MLHRLKSWAVILLSTEFQFSDLTRFSQNFKISINGCQAYVRPVPTAFGCLPTGSARLHTAFKRVLAGFRRVNSQDKRLLPSFQRVNAVFKLLKPHS